MSKFEEIDEFLDIEPIDVPKKNQIKKIEKKDDPTLDYEYSRGNLYSLIEKGQEAINGILDVAMQMGGNVTAADAGAVEVGQDAREAIQQTAQQVAPIGPANLGLRGRRSV